MKRTTIEDFMNGFIVGLAKLGCESIRYGSELYVHEIFEKTWPLIEKLAPENGLELGFRIRLDMHGVSDRVHYGLRWAARSGLIGFEAPYGGVINLKIDNSNADGFFRGVPGTIEMYEKIADEFLRRFRGEI